MRTRGLMLAFSLAAGVVLAADEAPRVAGTDVPVPRRLKFVAPEYPLEAQLRGLRGIVILDVIIDAQGKIERVEVTRSVPPFDEAAVAAVRQWEYEPTKVAGRPVAVRLTVPITFALKLPDMQRESGIPELRQGAAPAVPSSDAPEDHTVVAELTIDGTGMLVEGGVVEGQPPWADALLLAVRTWRFAPTSDSEPMRFKLKAVFSPAQGADKPARVALALSEPQKAAIPAEAAAATTAPAPAQPSGAPQPADPSSLSSPAPPPVAEPAPVAQAPPEPAPTPAPTPAPRPTTPPPPQTTQAPPQPAAIPAPGPSTGRAPRAPDIEVISPAPPPPPPPEAPEGLGVSVVRDVKVEAGLPDLVRGRRPVVPPFARIDRIEGTVELRFAVDSSGGTSHVEARGPDLLRDAAAQAVQSWSFRRTRADRLYLEAYFTYAGDQATATVKGAQAPAP